MAHLNISETHPSPILRDFHRYIDYAEKNQLELTAAHHYLRRKDLFALNKEMSAPQKGVTERQDQPVYTELHLFYYLAVASRLFLINREKPSTPRLPPDPERLAYFRGLNPTGQYFFLFKSLWEQCDWEQIQPMDYRHVSPYETNQLFGFLASLKPGRPVALRNPAGMDLHDTLSLDGIIQYLGFFGFWECRLAKQTLWGSSFYHPVDSIVITPFGKAMLKRIAEYALPSWRNPFMSEGGFMDFDFDPFQIMPEHIEIDPEEAELFLKEHGLEIPPGKGKIEDIMAILIDQIKDKLAGASEDAGRMRRESEEEEEEEKEEEPLEAYFRDLFPPGALEEVESLVAPAFKPGRYTFKVYLKYDPKTWRKIEADAHHSLDNLHGIIQEAFEFDNDHLYAFYMDDRTHSRFAFQDPRGNEPPFASEVRIGDLDLYAKNQFLYFFDFGDSWEFEVLLLDIKPEAARLMHPKVTESHGASPPQYAYNWDEDEEEFDDEEDEA